MKKTSIILIAATFLAACGAQDEPVADETASVEAAVEVEAEPECDSETDEGCDHTGTVNVPPDRN